MKIGIGFDVHRLVSKRKLFLAGLEIPYPKGLLGHSDGDVVLHAVADAILGSLAKPDIGCLFPDTDKKLKGIASTKILKTVLEIMRKEKFRVNNLDLVLVSEKPKLAPWYEKIRANLARLLTVKETCIGIKAKTAERIGEIGRGNAIACLAIVSLVR